jgi:hypothetical protein
LPGIFVLKWNVRAHSQWLKKNQKDDGLIFCCLNIQTFNRSTGCSLNPAAMQKKILLLFPVVIACVTVTVVRAQSPENTINLYGLNYPREKIHIHFDKDAYFPGETVWFKSYILGDNQPSYQSTNFYIALYDAGGNMIGQKVSPVVDATSAGYFQLPDSIPSGVVVCRAYTAWMVNSDSNHLFTQPIRILNNNKSGEAVVPVAVLRFFPEGSDIISGEKNTIAFKAAYTNGKPYPVEAHIRKEGSDEVVLTVKALHDGMGRFDMEQEPGQVYYATWADEKGVPRKTYLPPAKTTGVALKLAQQANRLFYNLANRSGSDTLHVLAYMYQRVIYKADIPVGNGARFTGAFPVEPFPSGVMQFTVFDQQWRPVAERVSFINNSNYLNPVSLNLDGIRLQKRAKNTIEIQLSDTLPANMSISVTDADVNTGQAGNNIIGNMLVNADVRGYVYNPDQYFGEGGSLNNELDLVMLTNGWRRYNWDDMRAGKMPEKRYGRDNYLTLYGRTTPEVLPKLDKDEPVTLMMRGKDSSVRFYSALPDKEGYFTSPGMVFYDTAKVFYSFNKHKSYNNQIRLSPGNNTLTAYGQISFDRTLLRADEDLPHNASQAIAFHYAAANTDPEDKKSKTLQGVTVKGRQLSPQTDPMMVLDDRYTTGWFQSKVFGYGADILHDEQAEFGQSIYSYLLGKLPGLELGYKPGMIGENRVFLYRKEEVLIYIDEHPYDNDYLENVQVNQLAYAKLITRSAMAGPSLKPVLALYYKKWDDVSLRKPQLTDMRQENVMGYSPVKEFYSPDYSDGHTGGTDARSTLYWQPYIFSDVAHRNIPVSFYNNDFTTRFRIVLEGINTDGKLIHAEKIVE